MAFTTATQAVTWLREQGVTRLVTDHRMLTPSSQDKTAFIAWPGAAVDARQFVTAAFQNGAVASLMESKDAPVSFLENNNCKAYQGLKEASGTIAAQFYNHPSHALKVIAFTGTNGKTSSSWWLAQALSALPAPYTQMCAVVGTLGTGLLGALENNGLTTPDPVLLQDRLRSFITQGCQAVALEASSIGIAEGRLSGTQIHTAVFTNFTQDHLDYHGDMDTYWQAKAALFDWPQLKAAVVNVDDAQGLVLIDRLSSAVIQHGFDLWTISATRDARLQAKNIQTTPTGLTFEVFEGDTSQRIQTTLFGHYNVSNLMGMIASMRSLGVPLVNCVQACKAISSVPGRMEVVSNPSQPLVLIDYAHTPDALAKVLKTLQETAATRQGKLWCIFGCGGNRDASKRPIMGATARSFADRVVVTSDNPRDEVPSVIIAQILLGLESHADAEGRIQVQADRALAIAQTIAQAAVNDVIVIAGKGHEHYQEITGIQHPFSDQAHAQLALGAWRSSI